MNKIKRYLLGVILFVAPALSYAQSSDNELSCELGFKYQLSYQNAWGGSSAVVVSVEPNSPAAHAGIRIGDIINKIDEQTTAEMDEDAINNELLRTDRRQVRLSVSNFGYQNKDIILTKVVRPIAALDEAQLAQAFNMYSLEDVTDRRFTLPFVYTIPSKKDFTSYKTFSIVRTGASDENQIGLYDTLIKTLRAKGLSHIEKGGDLLISASGSVVKNPLYRGKSITTDTFHNYRYDCQHQEVRDFPLSEMSSPDYIGEYKLSLTIQVIDAQSKEVIWSVTSSERPTVNYELGAYARSFVPLMFMNFPFARYMKYPVYVYHRRQYFYTGVNYDSRNLRQIYYVDPDSPAAYAGLHAGDEIEAINGIKVSASADELSSAYKRFITTTFKHRAPETIYADDNGFQRCMYWAPNNYDQIAKMVHNSAFRSVFSYLFSFRPYIYNPPIEEIIFEVKRDGQKLSFIVHPQKKNTDYIELK